MRRLFCFRWLYTQKFDASISLEDYASSRLGGYTIYRYTTSLKVVKRADSIQIDPNGGVLTYLGEEHKEAFIVEVGEEYTTLSFLSEIEGFLMGYTLSGSYRSGNEIYTADSEIPILFTTITAQWTRKDFIVASVSSVLSLGSYNESITMGGSQVKGFNTIGRQYYTFDHYYLAYLDVNQELQERPDITFYPNSVEKVNFSFTYLTEDIYKAIDASGLSASNYANPTVFLVSVFTRNTVTVNINGNGGVAQEKEDTLHNRQVSEDGTTVTYTYYQDELSLSLTYFMNDFGMTGHAIRDLNLTVYNDAEVIASNPRQGINTYPSIENATRVEIICNWYEVIAYVSRKIPRKRLPILVKKRTVTL